EQRGIERVPEDERTDTNGATSIGTMWLAANMVVPSFAIGALATPVFGLGFVDTILTIFINMLGITPVSFFRRLDLALGYAKWPYPYSTLNFMVLKLVPPTTSRIDLPHDTDIIRIVAV